MSQDNFKGKGFGEKLYNALPPIYHQEDSKITPDPYPLKRFFQIAGVGLDHLADKIEGHFNMYDIDKCPPEFLPHLFRQVGFDVPYDMTEVEQRGLLKLVPTLYKLKGTTAVFEYLALQIFNKEATTKVTWANRIVENDEVIARNKITLNIDVNGEGGEAGINRKLDLYKVQAEKFRPVNHELFTSISLYYEEWFEELMRDINDDYLFDQVKTFDVDTYDLKNLASEILEKEIIRVIDEEVKDFTLSITYETLDQFKADDGEEDGYILPKYADTHSEKVALDEDNENYYTQSVDDEHNEVLQEVTEDEYNKGSILDEDVLSVNVAVEEENAKLIITEEDSGVILDWTHSLNSQTKRLNTLRLSRPTQVTYI